jgi:hypothetical protein
MSNIATFLISVITVVVLYADDIRVLAIPMTYDLEVDLVLLASMIIFFFELII